MKITLSYFLLILFTLPIFSEDSAITNRAKRFNIPASEFLPSGFKVSLSGTPKASHVHSPGQKHPGEALFLSALFLNLGQLFNLSGGQFQRDNILNDNVENFSYFNQPYEKISPLGKIGFNYTTKTSEWTFDISVRAKNYAGKYVLGNNRPYEYFPGELEYNWREGQYSIIRNHAIYNFFMVQPQIGVREIREDYQRKSDLVSYPVGKRYSSLSEQSQTFSQQAGISFIIKPITNLNIKLTTKIFQPINGNLKYTRNDFRYENSTLFVKNFQSKTNHVYSGGSELEGEISYMIRKINLFMGYNLTSTIKEARRDKNFVPTIVTNENLTLEYLRYFIANSIFETNYLGNPDENRKPRIQTLKYLYFGASVSF